MAVDIGSQIPEIRKNVRLYSRAQAVKRLGANLKFFYKKRLKAIVLA